MEITEPLIWDAASEERKAINLAGLSGVAEAVIGATCKACTGLLKVGVSFIKSLRTPHIPDEFHRLLVNIVHIN